MKQLKGFTIIEIAIVILIIAVLVTLSVVSYRGLQERAAKNTVLSDLQNAGTIVEQYALKHGGEFPDNDYLVANFNNTNDVNLSIVVSSEEEGGGSTGPIYTNLTPVQNAVLFHEVCRQVISEPEFQVLRSHNGQAVNSTYNIWCGSSDGISGINAGWYQINGWNSTNWNVPITQSQIDNRINNPPTDSWWNIADLDSRTYREIRNRFLATGGTFPITSIWDSWGSCGPNWAGVWTCNGTPREALPALPPAGNGGNASSDEGSSYCIVATHQRYSDIIYSFSSDSLTPKAGNCNDTVDN